LAITAIIAAGLALVVNPPLEMEGKAVVAVSPAGV
jgi:hypothetical protein